jgi:hypothetical protein
VNNAHSCEVERDMEEPITSELRLSGMANIRVIMKVAVDAHASSCYVIHTSFYPYALKASPL